VASNGINTAFHTNLIDSYERDINDLVTKYFNTENLLLELSNNPLESNEIVWAQKILKESTLRVDQSYETALLWSRDNVILPYSFYIFLKGLHMTERKIFDSDKQDEYKQTIINFVYKGYARKLTKDEAEKVGSRTWYLIQYVKNQNANRGKDAYLVDIKMNRVDNEMDAYEISNDVKNVHNLANFDLRGCISNSSNI